MSVQVRFAGTGPVVLFVQERGQGGAGQPVGRPSSRVLGSGGDRSAGRRQGAHRGPASPRAPVSRALRLRASAVRRAEHDQRRPRRAAGRRRRERPDDRRGPAGGSAGRGRRKDHRHLVRDGPAHHRSRLRGTVRVLQQDPRLTDAVVQ